MILTRLKYVKKKAFSFEYFECGDVKYVRMSEHKWMLILFEKKRENYKIKTGILPFKKKV